MPKEPLTIAVDPTSDLARALAEASTTPVRLDVNGVPYRVTPEHGDNPWTGYDLWGGQDPEWGGIARRWQAFRASTEAPPEDERDPEESD